jgi:integral membrane protein
MKLLSTAIGRLRVVGFFEGISFLVLLFIAMPLKYMYDMPDVNKVVGMIHGLLFVLYVFGVIQVRIEYSWNLRKTMIALIASVLPFGTFYADAKLFKSEQQAQKNS